jgi:hypothetical protein
VLPKRKIATQHSTASSSERSGYSYKEGRIGICSSAMGQRQPGASAKVGTVFGTMKISANRRIERRIVKCLDVPGGRSHCVSGQLNFFQHFKHFDNTNFVPQFRPAALHFRILIRRAARILRLPIAQKHVL